MARAGGVDPRGEGPRRGDRAHRQVRLAAHRRDRRRRQGARPALPARGRLELGDVERLDARRRRLRVRPRRRDRHLDRQAARARAGGPRRPDHAEVRRAGPRRGSHLKVGVLGGTFDPVHNAHLAMARAALEHLKLDKILWVPTGKPGYRQAPIASADDRLAMLKLALGKEPRYQIDERELGPAATGYTVDTLRSLRKEMQKAELYLLIGADQHEKFHEWRSPGEIERLAKLAVFPRPGFKAKGSALIVPMPPMP